MRKMSKEYDIATMSCTGIMLRNGHAKKLYMGQLLNTNGGSPATYLY